MGVTGEQDIQFIDQVFNGRVALNIILVAKLTHTVRPMKWRRDVNTDHKQRDAAK